MLQVDLRLLDDHPVDVAQDRCHVFSALFQLGSAQRTRLDAVMPHDLPQHAAVSSSDDTHVLGVGVGEEREMRDHLVVGELVSLRALDHSVQRHHLPVRLRLIHRHVLVLGLAMEQVRLDLDRHGLSRPATNKFSASTADRQGQVPLVVDLQEPSLVHSTLEISVSSRHANQYEGPKKVAEAMYSVQTLRSKELTIIFGRSREINFV
eukprot:128694-Hanusia_phi.AAC.1